MSRQEQVSTVNVPEPRPGSKSEPAPRPKRQATPFVIVPDEMVVSEDKLEPHWLPAIDSATD